MELPRRDVLLLPLIALVTVLIITGLIEIGARVAWSVQETDRCIVTDPVLGYRATPGCTVTLKAAESPIVQYNYNSCGYRTPQPCGPKPSGTIRVAVIGSSTSMGYLTPYPDTVNGRLTHDLAAYCGRPVEFQALGLPHRPPPLVVRTVDEALALQPDELLWAVSPFDLQNALLPPALARSMAAQIPPTPVAERSTGASIHRTLVFIREMLVASRAALVAQHYLFRNISFYVPAYLQSGDRADFLNVPLSAAWLQRVGQFARIAGEIASKARDSGVPFTILLVPQAAQAALATGYPGGPNADAFALGHAMQQATAPFGANFVDGTSAFTHQTWSADYFYMADGHLAASGSAVLADYLLHWLIKPASSVFSSCRGVT